MIFFFPQEETGEGDRKVRGRKGTRITNKRSHRSPTICQRRASRVAGTQRKIPLQGPLEHVVTEMSQQGVRR